jgi:hypothetical protein
MTQIISLMQELNLNEEVISNTISKMTLICAKNDYPILSNRNFSGLNGNGDGNGNGNN